MTDKTTSHSTRLPKICNLAAGYKLKLFVTLITGLTLSFPAAAKLYKWVDDNGTTHYGQTIPPEYAGKDRVELNKEGRVIKNDEVMTPERRRAKELEDEKAREEAQAALEQQRRDKTLINTYSNVNEIDLARKRSMQQVDARINVLNSYIKSTSDKLTSLQTEADNYTNANRKIPPSLRDDLTITQERLDKLQQDLDKPNKLKAALEARYKADRARYIELTGRE
jgi:chromosome segregation ATPase